MTSPLHTLTSRIDRCLTQPEPNAAGRMGLVRILYALFYLWSLHDYRPEMLYRMPERFRRSIPLNGWDYIDPAYGFLTLLAPALVIALVLLLVGLHTRLATLAVLVVGGLMEAYFVSLDLECGNTFLKVFIPLFVLIGGDWGATYSLDAMRRRRAGHTLIAPADTSVRFVLPIRASLVLLSFLFLTGAVWKSMPTSTWFSQDNLFGHMLLTDRIENAMAGRPLAPVAGLFVAYPILDTATRGFVVIFEGLFFLSLFHRRVRVLFVSMALVFHATNAIWLGVTFSQIMIVYALFIDWESMRARLAAHVPGLGLGWAALMNRAPSGVLVAGSYGLAITCGVLWHQTRIMQHAVTLGGLLDTYTVWYPVLPLAMFWCAATIFCLLIVKDKGTEQTPQA